MPKGLPDSIIYTQAKKISRRATRRARQEPGFFESLTELLCWGRDLYYRAKSRKSPRPQVRKRQTSRIYLVQVND